MLSVLPGVTIYDASKEHVHSKFHILSLESKFLETYLALETRRLKAVSVGCRVSLYVTLFAKTRHKSKMH